MLLVILISILTSVSATSALVDETSQASTTSSTQDDTQEKQLRYNELKSKFNQTLLQQIQANKNKNEQEPSVKSFEELDETHPFTQFFISKKQISFVISVIQSYKPNQKNMRKTHQYLAKLFN